MRTGAAVRGALLLDRMIAKQYDSLDNIVEGVRALKACEIRGRSIMVYDTPPRSP